MKSQQRYLQAQNNTLINIKSHEKYHQVSENESQYEIPQKSRKGYRKKDISQSVENNREKGFCKHWTLQENIEYKKILIKKKSLFQSDFNKRKVKKINVLMSEYIKIKTPNQCRSHHQKMMKKYKNITGIIKFIEKMENDHYQSHPRYKTIKRALTNNSSAQQENEKSPEESLQVAQTPCQIESLQLQDIIHRQAENYEPTYDLELIQDCFKANLWWDGFEI